MRSTTFNFSSFEKATEGDLRNFVVLIEASYVSKKSVWSVLLILSSLKVLTFSNLTDSERFLNTDVSTILYEGPGVWFPANVASPMVVTRSALA